MLIHVKERECVLHNLLRQCEIRIRHFDLLLLFIFDAGILQFLYINNNNK